MEMTYLAALEEIEKWLEKTAIRKYCRKICNSALVQILKGRKHYPEEIENNINTKIPFEIISYFTHINRNLNSSRHHLCKRNLYIVTNLFQK